MSQIEFSLQLAEHVGCPAKGELKVGVLQDGLAIWFEEYPKLKEYLLDSDGNLRRHLSLFLNGEMVISTEALDLVIDDKSELFVMQAISGG